MRKPLLPLAVALISAVPTLAFGIDIPHATEPTNLAATSFQANWDAVEGASSYKINLLTESQRSTTVSNDINVTIDGTTRYYTDKVNGFVKDVILTGTMVNSDGASSAYDTNDFFVALYDAAGNLILKGNTLVWVFNEGYSLHLKDAFSAIPHDFSYAEVYTGTGYKGDVQLTHVEIIYNEPDLAAVDVTETATSHTFEGLDPDKIYFYNVKSVDAAGQSEAGNLVMADYYPAPEALAATNVLPTSFEANWSASPKAISYKVNAYDVVTMADDCDYTLLADNFDKAQEGTRDNPVDIADNEINNYTSLPGWEVTKGVVANGMIGTNGGFFVMPKLNLAGNDGNFNVTVKLYGTPGDQIAFQPSTYVSYATYFTHKTAKIPESGYLEETWTQDKGSEELAMSINSKSAKLFFIDEISVSQPLTAGSVVKTLVANKEVEAPATSVVFDNLQLGHEYAYEVQGFRYNYYGYEDFTAPSQLVTVSLATAIPSVENEADAEAEYYDLQGKRIDAARAIHGIYIRRCGTKVEKIVAQ